MQIKLNLQIFIFIIILIFTQQIGIYVCLMVFALIHELGHIIAGIMVGLKPKSLHIMPLGVSLVFEEYRSRKLVDTKKIIISASGPLVNLAIAFMTIFISMDDIIKQTIIYSNLLIFIFNLIPLYPLDGGRILKNILKIKYGTMRAERIINKLSNMLIIFITIISSILLLYIQNFAILFIALYLWILVIKENKRYSMKKKVYKLLE